MWNSCSYECVRNILNVRVWAGLVQNCIDTIFDLLLNVVSENRFNLMYSLSKFVWWEFRKYVFSAFNIIWTKDDQCINVLHNFKSSCCRHRWTFCKLLFIFQTYSHCVWIRKHFLQKPMWACSYFIPTWLASMVRLFN